MESQHFIARLSEVYLRYKSNEIYAHDQTYDEQYSDLFNEVSAESFSAWSPFLHCRMSNLNSVEKYDVAESSNTTISSPVAKVSSKFLCFFMLATRPKTATMPPQNPATTHKYGTNYCKDANNEGIFAEIQGLAKRLFPGCMNREEISPFPCLQKLQAVTQPWKCR